MNYFETMVHRWLTIKQCGGSLVPYFEDNLIHNVAIYGMGALGESLMRELRDTSINLSYAIDRRAAELSFQSLKVYDVFKESYPLVDAICVTPAQDYYNIEKGLSHKNIPLISLEDVIEYCYGKSCNSNMV